MNDMKYKLVRKVTGFTLVEIMIVVMLIGILLAISVPTWVQARERSRSKGCEANLKQIDSAVQQWMMDNRTSSFGAAGGTGLVQATPGDTAFASEPSNAPTTLSGPLVTTYIRAEPACPEGGLYSTGDGVINQVTCSLATADPAKYGPGSAYPHTLGGT